MARGERRPEYPSFRRPRPPAPVEAIEVPHPDWPEELDGLTVLHLADFHARHGPHALLPGAFSRLLEAVREVRADLVVLTGDCMHEPGHEAGGVAALRLLSEAWRSWGGPRLGVYGVFGNHDTLEFARGAREMGGVAGVTWLDHPDDEGRRMVETLEGGRLRLLGMSWPEDALAAALALDEHGGRGADGGFVLCIAHMPTAMIPCAAIGVPVVLAGHTHGGQVRLSSRHAPYTAGDVPANRASGMLRLGGTLCCISRGLGDAIVPGLRWNCPQQAPLYTMRRGEMPALKGRGGERGVRQVVGW